MLPLSFVAWDRHEVWTREGGGILSRSLNLQATGVGPEVGSSTQDHTFLIQHPAPCRERSLSGPPWDSDLVLGLSKALTIRAMRKVPSICTGGDSKVTTLLNFCCLPSGWVPQDRLRARVMVTRQQATQAESQLQELQQQSSRIEVIHHVLMSGLTP